MVQVVGQQLATPVFLKIWEAINAANPDGSRKYRYIINTGSSRSSKTASIIQCCDLYCRTHLDKRVTAWRETKRLTKDSILKDIQKYFRIWPKVAGRTFNKTEAVFTYANHSTFEMHGTDDEENAMGVNTSICWLNEPYKISRETFDQLDQRASDLILIDWNPKKSHWIEDVAKDERAIVINSTFRDNPLCPPEERRKILGYQTVPQSDVVVSKLLTEKEANEYDLIGNPNGFTSRQIIELTRCRNNHDKNSANPFNWDVYGLGKKGERPNRIFRWEEIPDEEYKALPHKIYYGCDWGVVDPWAIVEAKYHDGCLYLHERNYASENEITTGMSVSEMAAVKGADEGLVSWVFAKLDIDKQAEIVCDTNRPTKITALRRSGWGRAQPAAKVAGSIIDGIALLNNLRVYYTRSSTNVAYEQENYSREVDRYGTVLEDPADVDNHTMDASRYIALHLHRLGVIRKV